MVKVVDSITDKNRLSDPFHTARYTYPNPPPHLPRAVHNPYDYGFPYTGASPLGMAYIPSFTGDTFSPQLGVCPDFSLYDYPPPFVPVGCNSAYAPHYQGRGAVHMLSTTHQEEHDGSEGHVGQREYLGDMELGRGREPG